MSVIRGIPRSRGFERPQWLNTSVALAALLVCVLALLTGCCQQCIQGATCPEMPKVPKFMVEESRNSWLVPPNSSQPAEKTPSPASSPESGRSATTSK